MALSEYLEKTKSLPPSPLLTKAITLLQNKRTALDLGAGAGKDTRYLVENGFQVTSVDKDSQVGQILASLPNQQKLNIVNTTFDKFNFDKYDLINAHFALPFNSKGTFSEVWHKVRDSLNPGGIFVGQFFGPKDSWNNPEADINFHTLEQVKILLEGLETVKLSEEDLDATTTLGRPKHWHIFHVIARKPV